MDTVILRTFDNFFKANILLTRLRDAGIECYLKDEYTVTIDPLLSNAIGGIKLIVPKHKLQEAEDMLQVFQIESERIIRCPKCGNNDFVTVPVQNNTNRIAALVSWLFSSEEATDGDLYKCTQCGYEADTLPEVERF
ncbi:hypothetical protein BH09BAC2_BH09BAC2_04260 [soil metagenome]